MRKTLAFILAVALLCIMAVGTTLTYFTDTDFDKNTMTVGNVGITQYEKDRYGAQIDDDALKLYPATAGVATDGLVPAANNGVDKFVTVKLDDNSENAYVRTVFAFEMMKVDGGWKSPIADKVILVDNGIQMTNIEIEKNGVHYIVGVCTYDGVLTKGDTTAPSLKQVYLASNVGNEFSTAVDGSYEILAVSQAVQSTGFANAADAFAAAFPYGENNANVANWFN